MLRNFPSLIVSALGDPLSGSSLPWDAAGGSLPTWAAGNIWCRGDSLTLGYNAQLGGFFKPLFDALTLARISSTFVGTVQDAATGMWHTGISGNACQDAKANVQAGAAALLPDIAIFWLGTNDPVVYSSDLATTKADWDLCIAGILAGYPQARIIAPGPIDRTGWTTETAAIDTAMPGWCADHVAAGRNVTYVDLRSVVSIAGGDYHGDGAHLLESGYAKLVAPLKAAITILVHTSLIPTPVTVPVVTGTPGVGNLLSSTTGAWTSAPSSYSYQWTRNGANITGATSSTYLQIGADDGTTVVSLVSAINVFGTSNPAASNAISVPVSSVPVATTAPVVTGGKLVGDTLSCTTGTWTHSPTSYTYRWLRDGVAIGGATSSTYVRVAADIGPVIRGAVVGHNALDDGIEENSNAADVWALSDLTHAPEFQLDHPTGAVGASGAPSANLGTAGSTLTTVATVVALLNGIKCRQFAAASNDLIYESAGQPASALVTTSEGHILIVARLTAITNDLANLAANEALVCLQSPYFALTLRSSTGNASAIVYNGGYQIASDSAGTLPVTELFEMWWDGTGVYVRVAGAAPVMQSTVGPEDLASTLRIGRAYAGGGGGTITGIIGEVFISKVIPAAAEQATFRAYLAWLYGGLAS